MKHIKRAKQTAAALQRAVRSTTTSQVTAAKLAELTVAAHTVVSERHALGMRAHTDPLVAHSEFARLVPEKVRAFSEAGVAITRYAAELTGQVTRMAAGEVAAATAAATRLASCRTPVEAMAVNGRLAMDWWGRGLSRWMSMAALATRSQAAILAPVHLAATRNARRLRAS
jgi:hypothetical protein